MKPRSLYAPLLVVALLLCTACTGHSQPPATVANDSLTAKDSMKTTPSRQLDFPDLGMEQMMVLRDSNFAKTPLNPALKAFLRQPIDLAAFKRSHQGPNTSTFRAPEWMPRPQYPGFFMRYFIFPGFGEHGPELVVYRKGNTVGDFNEDRDELLQFELDRHDPKLGDADLLGRSIADLEARFGKVHLRHGAFLYYRDHQGHLLSLSVGKGNTVLWYKWMSLTYNVNALRDVPKEARSHGF